MKAAEYAFSNSSLAYTLYLTLMNGLLLQDYVVEAAHYSWRLEEVPLPRSPEEVPQDLLTSQEREVNRYYSPAWIRIDYSRGTDERHRQLLNDIDESLDEVFDHDNAILNDASRYNTIDLLALFAFVPVMLEFPGGFYDENDVPWDSEDLRAQFLDAPEPGDPQEVLMEKRMIHQRHFFIADHEAMTSGQVLWVHVDQFGEALQRNRVEPEALTSIRGYKANGLSLEEIGVGYRDGQAFTRRARNPVLRQWMPPPE